MINLYLIRGIDINFTNIVQSCMVLGRTDLYDTCQPVLKNYLLSWDSTEFVNIGGDTPIRMVDWRDHTDQLDYLVDNNLTRVITTYRDDQMEFVKQYLGDKCFTVTFNYDESYDYPIMLAVATKTHIHRQKIGEIELTPEDIEIRQQRRNLLSYYTRALRNQNLFPEMLEPAGDYSFKLGDLFNKELFFQNVKALGVTETPEASEYYDKSHTAFNHLLESY